jgi:hypothetical protein
VRYERRPSGPRRRRSSRRVEESDLGTAQVYWLGNSRAPLGSQSRARLAPRSWPRKSPKAVARCRFAWVRDSQLRGSPRDRSGRRPLVRAPTRETLASPPAKQPSERGPYDLSSIVQTGRMWRVDRDARFAKHVSSLRSLRSSASGTSLRCIRPQLDQGRFPNIREPLHGCRSDDHLKQCRDAGLSAKRT